MSAMRDTIGNVIAALEAGGVSCVADPAELNPPAALVAVEQVHPNLLDGSGSIDVRVNLCAPDVAWEDALEALDTLLVKAMDAIDLDDPIVPETLIVSGAQLPSLRGTVTYFYERETD